MHAFVIFFHFGKIILYPTLLYGLILFLPSLFQFNLSISFLENIAHKHLWVESFHFVLGIIGFFGCKLKSLTAFLLIICLFFLINTSSCKLKKVLEKNGDWLTSASSSALYLSSILLVLIFSMVLGQFFVLARERSISTRRSSYSYSFSNYI